MALRGTGYACVFFLVGAVAVRGLLRSDVLARTMENDAGEWSRQIPRGLAIAAMLTAFGLVVVDLLRLWHQTYAFYGGFEPITRELVSVIANDTLWGSGWKVQALSAAVAGIAFAGAARRWPGSWLVAMAAVTATTAARPLTGHAVEQGSWLSLPAILQAIHVVAAALWLGTLLAMTTAVFWRARTLPEATRSRFIAAMVNGFSPLALSAATALFVAGCATSFLYLGSPAQVLATTYGRVLGAKIVAFGGVAALGYFNWRSVKPRLSDDLDHELDGSATALLLRSAAAELAVAVVVLLLTAALVALPMPAG